MPKAPVGEDKIYYEIHGQGEPLILIAGLGGDHTQWHWQLPDYSKEFQCIVFDNRGIGKSSPVQYHLHEEKYTLELLAADVVRLMDYLEIEKAHISGASMGGIVAQIIALAYPERVKTLSLHSTLAWSAPLVKLNFNTQIDLLNKLTMEELMLSLAPWIWSEETLEERLDFILEFRDLKKDTGPPASKEIYILQAKACLDFDLRSGLHEIKVPVQVSAGAEDILIHPRNSELIHRSVSGSEYVVFRGCGHAPLMEKYKEFNFKTLTFLKNYMENK